MKQAFRVLTQHIQKYEAKLVRIQKVSLAINQIIIK